MYDVITIGSATLDIIFKSKEFALNQMKDGAIALCHTYGDKIDVDQFKMVSGGGATNVAVGCQRLGFKTAVVCEVGKDFPSQMVLNELQTEGVDTNFVVSERLEETGVSLLLVAQDGGRSILTHRGAAYELESRDLPWDYLFNTRWIHLGSVGGDKELLFDLFEYMRMHEIGLSWTPSKKDLELLATKQLLAESVQADVLILNAQEWESVEVVHKDLLQHIAIIVVTDGRKGGKIYTNNSEPVPYQVDPIDAVEETGAGDAFATGFISGLLYGKSVSECVEWGKKNAVNVVKYLGAKQGLLTMEEMVSAER